MSALIAGSDPNCLFCRIVAGQIPARLVYQDDDIYAFHAILEALDRTPQVTPKVFQLLGAKHHHHN